MASKFTEDYPLSIILHIMIKLKAKCQDTIHHFLEQQFGKILKIYNRQ